MYRIGVTGGVVAVLFVCLLSIRDTLVGPDLIPDAVAYRLGVPLPTLPNGNNQLQGATRIMGLLAPEGFAHATAPDGRSYLFMSLQDGRVGRIDLRRGEVPTLANVTYVARTGASRERSCDTYSYDTEPECGRPLGMLYVPDRGLYVADSYHGLKLVRCEQLFAPQPDLSTYVPESVVSEYRGVPIPERRDADAGRRCAHPHGLLDGVSPP